MNNQTINFRKLSESKGITVSEITFLALMTAVMCILAPVSIPIGPVPISLTNLVIFFTVYVIGFKDGLICLLLYILLGVIGLPVFSGFAGGIGKLAGPTGGYIIGFIPMLIVGGIVMEKFSRKLLPTIVAWVVGLIVDYIFGTLWFVFIMKCDFVYALTVCVFPFVIGDLLKIAAGTMLGVSVRKVLLKIGIPL